MGNGRKKINGSNAKGVNGRTTNVNDKTVFRSGIDGIPT